VKRAIARHGGDACDFIRANGGRLADLDGRFAWSSPKSIQALRVSSGGRCMRLILVRHPRPLHEPGICYGRLDLKCDPEALSEAADGLSQMARGARVFTSPAQRALALAARLSDNPAVDARLQELDFGDWEGRKWDEIGQQAIETWEDGLPDSAPPNGEALSAMAARCADWVASLEPDERPVIAITHAGPIRLIRAILRAEPLLTYFSEAVPYGEAITLEDPPPALQSPYFRHPLRETP
jgi:alpha-ribazole phosphatase